MSKSTILVLWDPNQIDILLKNGEVDFFNNNLITVPLNYKTKNRLDSLKLPCNERVDYDQGLYHNLDKFAVQYSKKIINLPCLSFLAHRDINLLFIIQLHIEQYLGQTFHFIELFRSILEKSKKILIPNLLDDTKRTWEYLEDCVALDVVEQIADSMDVSFEIIKLSKGTNKNTANVTSYVRNIMLSIAQALRRLINIHSNLSNNEDIENRVLILDKWSNVRSVFKRMNNKYTFYDIDAVQINHQLFPFIREMWPRLRSKQIEFLNVTDVIDSNSSNVAKEKAKYFIECWELSGQDKIENLDIKYKNIPISRSISRLINIFLTNEAERIMLHIEATYEMLKNKKFDRILLRIDSRDLYRIVALIGNKYDIPTIVMQHGTFMFCDTGLGFNPVVAKKIFVYGEASKIILRNHGVDNSKIELIGSPRFDRHIRMKKNVGINDVIRIRNKLGVAKHEKLVVIASTTDSWHLNFPNLVPAYYDLIYYFESILSFYEDNPNVKIVIKMRPGDRNGIFHQQKVKEIVGKEIDLTFDGDLLELMIAANVVVSLAYSSTTVLEGMMLDKPVVAFDKKESHFVYKEMVEDGALIVAKDRNSFKRAMETLLYDPIYCKCVIERAKENMAKYYLFDGKSDKRYLKSFKAM